MAIERVIVDTNWVLDPMVKEASDILMAEGKGLMVFREVNVTVDGKRRYAVELEIDTERAVLIDVVRRAGLEILETAAKVNPPAQKSTLNLIIADADLVRCDLSALDQTALNHPKLRYLSRDIKEALIEAASKLRHHDTDSINLGLEMKSREIEELYVVASVIISGYIEMISQEPLNEELECPKREINALREYQELILKCFIETYGIFK